MGLRLEEILEGMAVAVSHDVRLPRFEYLVVHRASKAKGALNGPIASTVEYVLVGVIDLPAHQAAKGRQVLCLWSLSLGESLLALELLARVVRIDVVRLYERPAFFERASVDERRGPVGRGTTSLLCCVAVA